MKLPIRLSIVPYLVVFSVVFLGKTTLAEDAQPRETASTQATTKPAATKKSDAPRGSTTRPSAMVFDPQSKKYFIGGSAKFMLKQADASSPIDRIELSIDGGDYTPYSGAVTFPSEGKHTLKFRAINPVNNWSPVQFTEVFVDLTAPTTEANFTDGKFFRGEGDIVYAALKSTIQLAAQDNISGVAATEYGWEGASTYTSYAKALVVERPGAHTLYFRSADRVGNEEEAKSLNVIGDGSGPESDMQVVGGSLRSGAIHGKNYLIATDSVSFAFSAKDDLSGVKHIWVSVDGKPATPYIKPIYFLQEGPHTIASFAEDQVGNKEPSKSISLYTVSTPPRSTVTALGKVVNTGGINYARPDFSVKLEATDNVVGVDRIEWKNEKDPAFRTYVTPIRFMSLGMQTIAFRSVDRAGNMEPSRTYTVFLTDTPPQTTLETAQPLVVRDGITYSPAPNILTFNVKSSGVGVKETLVNMNDAGFHPYTGPITVNADRRMHKIAFKSVDKLGNEEQPQTVNYQMIGALPVIDLFISNDQNKEEQIRTQYFEGANGRGTASNPEAAPSKAKKPASGN